MAVRRVVLLVVALALVMLVATLWRTTFATAAPPRRPVAAAPADPDFPICEGQGTDACDERRPAVAYNPGVGEYLVVFQWDLAGPSNHDIMALPVTAAGAVVGSPFCVACSAADDEEPAVAWNSKRNEYLVVWQRLEGPGDCDVYGKIIVHTSGAGTEFLIARHRDDQLHPKVAYDLGSNQYLVVWEDLDADRTAPPNVYGVCVSENGTPEKVELTIAEEVGDQYRPSLATNGSTDHWLVTWNDTRSGGPDVYGREVDSAVKCSVAGAAFPIGDGPGDAGVPAVAWGQVGASGDGEFLTVWAEGSTMLARRIDGASFTPLGQPITVTHRSGVRAFPAVSFADQQQEWWVVWEDLWGTDGPYIYGQRLLPDGTVPSEGVDQRVSKDPPSLAPSLLQERPAMAYNTTTPITATGQALVAWGDHGHYDPSEAGYWGVWGRIWAPLHLRRAAFVPLVMRNY